MSSCISRFTFLLSTVLLLSSCVNNIVDDIPEEVSGEGLMTAKVNDEAFSANGIFVTAEASQSNDKIVTLAIGASELTVGGLTKAISLSLVSTDGSSIEAGETYTAASMSNTSAGEYAFEDNVNVNIRALSSNTDVATITITEIDMVAKRVSGTFSFDATDPNVPNMTYEVRNGEFRDVSFE